MSKKMIKKITACFLIISVSIGVLFAASGCNLIVKNDYRTANQVLATIQGQGGLTMTVTQNELMDFYNTYAYYLMSTDYGYGYTAEEAFDFCLESKIKSKYLISSAMVYLTDLSSGNSSIIRRDSVRYNRSSRLKPEDVLTWAEYYAAVYSTNKSMQDSLDTLIEDNYQDDLQSVVNDISKSDIDYIEFTEDTKAYLKDEYFVKQDIDKNSIRIHIVYDDGTKSKDFIVPDSYYTTEFSTSEAKTDSTFVISVDEKIIGSDGTVTYEAHQLTHTFDVVAPRATRTEKETTDDNFITINDVKISRYATKEEILAKRSEIESADSYSMLKLDPIDPEAIYTSYKNDPNADAGLVDALRQLNENLKSAQKDINYYYNSSFESAVLSALQHEVKKEALQKNPVTDEQIIAEYNYLYATGKDSYASKTTEKDKYDTFASAMKDGIETLYYYPTLNLTYKGNSYSLTDFFYVYQLLLKFSDEQSAFLAANIGANTTLAQQYYEYVKNLIEVRESNPDYDPDFDCPYHEKGIGTEADCIYEGEGICPSCPYILNEDGSYKMVSYGTIYNGLQDALIAIYNDNSLTEAQKADKAIEKFLEYVYKYNDDTGVMNKSLGYAIGPKGYDPNSGFDANFIDLCLKVYNYNNAALGGKTGNAFSADNTLAYGLTSYGVHMVMITSTPFDFNGGAGLENLTDAQKIDYLKRAVNLDGTTLYDKIKENLTSDLMTRAYTKYTNDNVKSDLKDDKDIVKIETKAYEKMIKKYTGD
jgi:hypothetical protein